jgi:hypothetical protein
VRAAIEERDVRSIDVLGRRLLLTGVPLASSELVLRTDICDPSRLLGRYSMESPFAGGTAILLGVTLPSMNAEDAKDRLACVGVIGVDALWCRDGGVYELVRLAIWPGRGRPPLPLS